MIQVFTNKTSSPQQIMTVDGMSHTVMPGDKKEIQADLLFPEELLRLGKFFAIEKYKPVIEEKRITRSQKDGGNK